MPAQKDILQFKRPYIIFADFNLLYKKIDGCANNPGKYPATKSW